MLQMSSINRVKRQLWVKKVISPITAGTWKWEKQWVSSLSRGKTGIPWRCISLTKLINHPCSGIVGTVKAQVSLVESQLIGNLITSNNRRNCSKCWAFKMKCMLKNWVLPLAMTKLVRTLVEQGESRLRVWYRPVSTKVHSRRNWINSNRETKTSKRFTWRS